MFASGTILHETWSNIAGTSITDIPLANAPNSSDQLSIFETPSNIADNYGTRIRGYLCAPVTGNYTFWIAGDDNVELWLSTSDNPASKVKIAYHISWTNSREWTKYASQQSQSIALVSGQKYYIEALMKEGGGGDNLAVGWQLPDGTLERPIAGSRLSPYDLGPNPNPNPNPNPTICSASGLILHETWTNIGGTAITDIPLSNSPNSSDQLNIFETPSNIADNYGTRMSGYLCAPATGNYTFWIAGDDNVELWLSTTDNPSAKVKVAYHSSWTNSREWTKFVSQQSQAIALVSGQKYYIEALMKEGSGGDNLAVGWQLPDGTLERPIPGTRLSPFIPSSGTSIGTGLTAVYFSNVDLTGTTISRIDPTVNFDWGTGSPDPSIGVDLFSARWTGQVKSAFTETYTFYTTSDDGVRLWVNNVLLIDNWTNHGPTENSGTISLTAGQRYDIKMEYYESSGGATATLSWSSASQIKQIIPSARLYTSASARFGEIDNIESSFTVYPIPATDHLEINFISTSIETLHVTLINEMSQAVVNYDVVANEGSNGFSINTASLPQGMYFLKITGTVTRYTRKIPLLK